MGKELERRPNLMHSAFRMRETVTKLEMKVKTAMFVFILLLLALTAQTKITRKLRYRAAHTIPLSSVLEVDETSTASAGMAKLDTRHALEAMVEDTLLSEREKQQALEAQEAEATKMIEKLRQQSNIVSSKAEFLQRMETCLNGNSKPSFPASATFPPHQQSQDELLKIKAMKLKSKHDFLSKQTKTLLSSLQALRHAPKSILADVNVLHDHILAISAPDEAIKCISLSNCHRCTMQDKCSWCPASSSCGNLEEHRCDLEFTFIPSQCSFDALPKDSPKNGCESQSNCSSCLSTPKCGLCSSKLGKQCLQGTLDGPENGEVCSDWMFNDAEKEFPFSGKFSVLSVNVGIANGEFGKEYYAGIIRMLVDSKADVLILQEVGDVFFHTLVAQPLLSHYHETRYTSTKAPGGLYILSIFPILDISYFEHVAPGQIASQQRERMLVAQLAVSSKKIAVATTILDAHSLKRRVYAMNFMFKVLELYPDVLFAGDFNFDHAAPLETQNIPAEYRDVWTDFGSGDGNTWNPLLNAKARISDPLSDSCRVDRVFLKSTKWTPESIQLFGDIQSPEYPTSHFALKSEFSTNDFDMRSCSLQ